MRLVLTRSQIVIFVFARVVLALARLSVSAPSPHTPLPAFPTQLLSEQTRSRIQTNAWPVFASLSWAFVMYIFRWQPDSIQPSLRSSMKYMYVASTFQLSADVLIWSRYVNSDHWDSFRNFLIHNT